MPPLTRPVQHLSLPAAKAVPASLMAPRCLIVAPASPAATPFTAVHACWRHLSTTMINHLRPATIVAPLMTAGWDILDLAEVLDRAGYRGQILIQSGPLPSSAMVLREIRARFPELSVEFLGATH